MNKQDLILDFIDGKIDPTQNDILFEHLYYDEDARTEFAQQIQILLNVNQAFKTVPVPSVVTSNIFAELGIKTNLFLNLYQRIQQSRYTKSAIVVVALLLITFSSFYLGKWYSNFNNNSNAVNKLSQNNVPIVSSKNIDFIAVDNTVNPNLQNQKLSNQGLILQNHNYLMQLANLSMISNSIERYYRKYYNNLLANNSDIVTRNKNKNSLLLSEENTNNNKIDEKLINTLDKSVIFSNAQQTQNSFISLTDKNYYSNQMILTNSFVDFVSSILPKDYKLEVSFSNMSTQSALPAGLNTNGKYQFDVNARYNLNSNSAIGVNIGYDNFPQEFLRNIQGKEFTQIQSPDLVYLGITYRYNYFQSPTNQFLIPYLDVMLGGTQVGPIIKAQIGANIPIWNRVGLNIGLLNSLLIYNVENTIYSTNKLNFVYGLNIKL